MTTRNIYYHKQYKIYRNKIVSINKALRTLYYDSVLKDSTIKINKKRPSSNIDNLKVKDKNLQQPSSISNAINRYFCNVPTELASKLPKSGSPFLNLYEEEKINLSLCSSKRNRGLSTIRKYRH